jgi:hypothetical protein
MRVMMMNITTTTNYKPRIHIATPPRRLQQMQSYDSKAKEQCFISVKLYVFL